MRPLLVSLAACAALIPPAFARAQTADQARLVFSVGLGQTSGGGRLWRVGRQPFVVDAAETDTLAVERSFRNSLDVILSGTYFPNDHLGYNIEAQLLGLGSEDACRIVANQGSPQTADLCGSINNSERGATSASLSGGLIYRVWSRQPLHPYVRANLGILISQQSFIKMSGRVRSTRDTTQEALLTLYEDRNPASLQPYLSFGGGVVAVIGRGYQLRFEVRDNWVRVPTVSGPAPRQGLKPPTSTSGKHVLSFTLGFDVVLERKRGRRY
jgi:hypothetical protein